MRPRKKVARRTSTEAIPCDGAVGSLAQRERRQNSEMRAMDDRQQQLFGLMEMAESQQKAVGEALVALGKQQAALIETVLQLRTTGQALVPAVKTAADMGVGAAVKAELGTLAEDAKTALEKSTQPVLDRLAGIVTQAEAAEAKIKGAVAWFGWRWAAVAGAVGVGVILGVVLIAWGLIWWERSQLTDLRAERDKVTGEVSDAQATLAVLEKRSGGVYYREAKEGRFLLIPKGYEALKCVNDMPCVRLK